MKASTFGMRVKGLPWIGFLNSYSLSHFYQDFRLYNQLLLMYGQGNLLVLIPFVRIVYILILLVHLLGWTLRMNW